MPPNLGNPDVEEIFCSENVLYHGQPVGIIIAENSHLANRAAKEVKITYDGPSSDTNSSYLSNILTYFVKDTKDNKIYPTLQDVLDANAVDRISTSNKHKTGRGYKNPKPGTTKSISGIFQIGGQYHYTMETQTCVCVPIEDGMDIYSSTQWVDLVQVSIAETLKVPESSLNLYVRRLGGGYGAKISRPTQIACATALAAHLLQRPVRFVMTIEANMSSIGKRYGCFCDYKVEVDDDGTIKKLTNDYTLDMGCSLNESPTFAIQDFFQNCYETSAWKWAGKEAKTDAPSNTWCRAPGTTEGIAMIENIMEHIAYETGKDPAAVRLANIPKGNKMKELAPDFLKDVGE
jgi:xanthine dehydrogenase/oxidase